MRVSRVLPDTNQVGGKLRRGREVRSLIDDPEAANGRPSPPANVTNALVGHRRLLERLRALNQ